MDGFVDVDMTEHEFEQALERVRSHPHLGWEGATRYARGLRPARYARRQVASAPPVRDGLGEDRPVLDEIFDVIRREGCSYETALSRVERKYACGGKPRRYEGPSSSVGDRDEDEDDGPPVDDGRLVPEADLSALSRRCATLLCYAGDRGMGWREVQLELGRHGEEASRADVLAALAQAEEAGEITQRQGRWFVPPRRWTN